MQSRLHSSEISSFTTSGAILYQVIGSGTLTNNSTEANAQIPFRTAGTLSHFQVVALAPGTGATMSAQVRINGSNGNGAVSSLANQSGNFEDTVGTDAVVAGDKVAYAISTQTSNYWIVNISNIFNSSTGAVSKFSQTAEGGITVTSSLTFYTGLAGILNTGAAIEANVSLPSSVSGTWKNLSAYVSSNTWSGTTTIGSRKNSLAGTLALSIGASASGLFEDTTHSDTIAVGDTMDYQVATAAGSGTIIIRFIASEFINVSGSYMSAVGSDNGNNKAFNGTYRVPISGSLDDFSTWGRLTNNVLTSILGNLRVRATANNLDAGSSTIAIEVNGAATAVIVSIGFGTTGTFSDTTHTVTVFPNNALGLLALTSGTTGNLTLTAIVSSAHVLPIITFTADGIIKALNNLKTFTTDGVIVQRLSKTFTADGIVRNTNTQTITADGIVKVKNNLLTFTADGIVSQTKTLTFTTDGMVKIITPKTFTVDGNIFAHILKTFTVDGDVDEQGVIQEFTVDGQISGRKAYLFTVDGDIVGYVSVDMGTYPAFFLDDIGFKNPKTFVREFIYTKTDFTMLTGKSTRDTSSLKEKYTMTFENLTLAQVNTLNTIIEKRKAVSFSYIGKSAVNIQTTVFPYIGSIVYDSLGSDYRSKTELELIEVS